jgi:hypothetical protein
MEEPAPRIEEPAPRRMESLDSKRFRARELSVSDDESEEEEEKEKEAYEDKPHDERLNE